MRGAAVWADVVVPVVAPNGWSRDEIVEGLAALERIRRCVDAASARLTSGLGATGRDSSAAIKRATGVSGRTARERAKVAEVAEKVPGAADTLARGDVSSEHLTPLASLANDPEAASGLLELAPSQSPEEFASTVNRFQLDRDEADLRERQRRAREFRFFDAEHGCVGFRGVLTPTEGAELRAVLGRIADAQYRAKHPERARELGGHGDPPLSQRLVDAFMTLVRGEQVAGAASRPSVIVLVDEARFEASVAGTGPGSGPVAMGDVVDLSDRADFFAAVRSMEGAILNFGRLRRFASPFQRLAVIARDGGVCAFPGCTTSHEHCDVHHVIDVDVGGRTDLEWLALLCKAHHTYLHLNRLKLVRSGKEWVVVADDDAVPWANTG